jgi:hypothetical protein
VPTWHERTVFFPSKPADRLWGPPSLCSVGTPDISPRNTAPG